jgi:peptidoglycan/LPS O-acetylase OafA/YrhL
MNILEILDSKKIEKIDYRDEINGLRAVAVLSVIFYHINPSFLSGGWLGVDIFYVISGYLITNLIISDFNKGNFSFKNFYIKRIKRILPALFFCLIITIPFSWLLLTPKAMLEFSSSIQSTLFFYSNIFFSNLDFYNAEPTKYMPLLHTWSLAIEEQFYIFYPAVVFFIYRYFQKFIFYGLSAIMVFSIYLNSTTADITKFYLAQYRIWELIFGALVVFTYKKINIKYSEITGIFMIFFSLFYFENTLVSLNSLEPKLLVCIGTALVINSSSKQHIYKLLSNNLLRRIGLVSYSAYLIHQPVIAFLNTFEEKYFYISNIYKNIIILVLVFGVAGLSWQFIEEPSRKNSITKVSKILIIEFIVIFSFTVLSKSDNGFETARFNHVPNIVKYYSENINIFPSSFDNTGYLYSNKTCNKSVGEVKYCTWFNSYSKKNIYLLGDSQTNALSVSFLYNLDNFSNTHNLNFLRGRSGRCLLSKQSDNVEFVKACDDEAYEDFIYNLDESSDIVIAFGRFDTWLSKKGQLEINCFECDYVQTFKQRLEGIAKHAKALYIIQPIPTYSFNVSQRYLYKKETWGEPITLDLRDWESRIKETDNFLKNVSKDNITVIPTVDIFCNEISYYCYASSIDQLYYSDSNHLTLEGANLITEKLKKFIHP